MTDTVEEILACLNREKIRCTYGVVGKILGVIPIAVGRRLGVRRPEASWVVNARTRKPTGYKKHQKHPDLYCKDEIIRTVEDLEELMRRRINPP